jgi:inner membrane protein
MTFEPYPVNPWRWHAILETADYYQTAEINTRTGDVQSDARRDTIYKPPDTPAVEVAKRTALGQAYLDWGTWAMVRDLGPEPVPGVAPPALPYGRAWTTIEFSDLRFDYSFIATRSGSGLVHLKSPLSGWVYVVDGRDEAGQGMGGRAQK